jgi:hypothetical protein
MIGLMPVMIEQMKESMSGFKGGDLSDRLGAAAAARKAQAERFKAKLGAEDPELAARRVERQAIVEARETRKRDKEVAKRKEEELRAAEARRVEAERQADLAARAAAAEAERLIQEANRPKQAIRDAALYAARMAAGSRR